MNLKEALTKELIDELVSRLDTCLVLGITWDTDRVLTFHRRCTGPNTWAMYAPLLAEIRWLNESFDSAVDQDGPNQVVEF
jgi:hypothetical protein